MKAILSGKFVLYRRIFNPRSCRWLLPALLMATLSGCAAFDGYPERATIPDKDLESLDDQINGAAVKACLDTSDVACRNKLIAARMHANDIRFSQFEQKLFRQTREAGFSATLATLGLTTTAAFASGGVSPILSGIAAFIIGGREAYQKEVLAERTVIAIHTAMRARRAEVALRLRAGLRLSIDEYPVALALTDLDEYYNAGTVLGALIGITEVVGAEAQRSERKLQEQLTFNLDAAAGNIRDLVCGDDPECTNPDTSKFAAIKACWPNAGVPNDTLMFDFIFQPAFAAERRTVGTCLGL